MPDANGVTESSTANNFAKKGGVSPSYKVENLSLQMEVLGMSSSVLDQIVEQRIASVGYLSLPFKNYYTFQSTHNSSSRFSVSSASWDRLWAVFRPSVYTDKSCPIVVNGYKQAGAFVSVAAANADNTNFDVGLPTYDLGGVFDTNKEKYVSKYFNFRQLPTSNSSPVYYQLKVNSASIPAYRLNTPEALAMTKNSIDYVDPQHAITLDQFKNNYHILCWRFCLPESDFNRLASGLDLRSVSASCSLDTENLGGGNLGTNLTLFAETSCELRLGSSRQIEIIN